MSRWLALSILNATERLDEQTLQRHLIDMKLFSTAHLALNKSEVRRKHFEWHRLVFDGKFACELKLISRPVRYEKLWYLFCDIFRTWLSAEVFFAVQCGWLMVARLHGRPTHCIRLFFIQFVYVCFFSCSALFLFVNKLVENCLCTAHTWSISIDRRDSPKCLCFFSSLGW
jgi:hypothetical protein